MCNICNKNFDSTLSLEQHNKSKHFSEERKKKKINKKYFIIIGLTLAIIIFGYTLYIRGQTPGEYDNFTKCLTEKETVIYGNDFCQYTTKQLNMFGNSKKYLKYIKCVDNEKLCNDKGIKITPTWEINGEMYEQVQSFEKLVGLSGCEI